MNLFHDRVAIRNEIANIIVPGFLCIKEIE